MWLVEVSIRRPVFAVMLIGALVALGFISVGRIGIDLFPAIELPYISVITKLEGASPEGMETEVTDVLEENINTISGIQKLQSTSSEGLSQILVEFELKEDIDVKAQDVREKVAISQDDLPPDIDAPIIEKVDPDAAPILSVMIAGDLQIAQITRFADEVAKTALERLPGVGSVSLVGGRKREIRVWLDVYRLRAFGLTAEDVVSAIRSEHAELPGGRMEMDLGARELGAKSMAEAKTVDEIGELVVAFRPDGAATRVRDIARVDDGLEDERTYAQLNGKSGVSLEVRRQSGRNTVEVSQVVKGEVERLRSIAPKGIEIVVARDISKFIETSIEDVTKELQIAIGLVVFITFFFLLSWRSTLIVAIAIPVSLISTFFILYVFNFTINMLTLLAMTIAIGLLVDDAIVVIEAIQRDIDRGRDRVIAAYEATKRVGLAVLAGTFATLAVFVPIAFMEGIVGRFFLQYGLTIVFSVSVSLLVALSLSPMLASRFLNTAHGSGPILAPIERMHKKIEVGYGNIIGWAVKFRYLVLVCAIGSVFVGGWFGSRVPAGFLSKADRSEFQGLIELPLGTGIVEARRIAIEAQNALVRVPHVEEIFLTVGAGSQQKANEIDIYVLTTPKQKRRIDQFKIMDDARRAVQTAVPLATNISIAEVPWVSGIRMGVDIEYVVRGSNISAVRAYSNQIISRMRKDPYFDDVQSTFESGRPEVQILVDRMRSADLGISARSIATTTRTLIGGIDAGNFEDNGKRYDIRVRLEEEHRQTIDQLSLIQVRAVNGTLIDLTNVADIKIASGPAQIERQDRARMIAITANTATGIALGDATSRMQEIVDVVALPEGLIGSFEGQAKRMADSVEAIGFAFVLAIVALYMVLASQFNSFIQPFVIMVTAPLSFSGAFAGLYYGNQEMSIFAQIGLIALMGIVMKNGILLVDRANQLIAEGATPREAMKRAGPERLRPVLMTAFAAIFGMIPVAMSGADGSEWRNVMGFLIIGGLLSSTFLTLVVVPAAYLVPQDILKITIRMINRIGKAPSVLTERLNDPQ